MSDHDEGSPVRVAVVPARHQGERLPRYLRRVLPELDRRAVGGLVAGGRVVVDGVVCTSLEHSVSAGSRLVVRAVEGELPGFDPDALILCDERIVALAKPPGLTTTITPVGEIGVVELLAARLGATLYPVHRLDRGTSGVLVIARDPATAALLAAQFRARTTRKRYLALVSGSVVADEGEIMEALAPAGSHTGGTVIDAEGRRALTRYRVLERRTTETLLELHPLTGRRHQLRAHLAHLGHPIVGDEAYGGSGSSRMWLHAATLVIALDGELLLDAPPPPELYPRGGLDR